MQSILLKSGLVGFLALFIAIDLPKAACAARGGQLLLSVVDQKTGTPLAARIHLENAAGRTVKIPKVPALGDHAVFDGSVTLKLPRGVYRFLLECGPEYLHQHGHFEIKDFADDEKTVEMRRFVNMAAEGWYSGDFDVRRPLDDLPLLMKADDLHVALVTPPAKQRGALPKKLGKGEQPLEPGQVFDDNRVFVLASDDDTPPVLLEPAAWDLPVQLATGDERLLALASSRLQLDRIDANEKNIRPRDKALFPGDDGLARFAERTYFHALNSGVRPVPIAASGSGTTDNPVGYNRVYVQLPGEFSYGSWLEGLKAGRVVVTNGPMLRPTVEGEYPGHEFLAEVGETVELEVALNLATRETIDYLEIVQDGRPTHTVRLAEFEKTRGRLPKVVFEKSGWFLVRVVTNNQDTYRFAMSAPWYVRIGYEPAISRESTQFFADWLTEAQAQRKLTDVPEAEIDGAKQFWRNAGEKANRE
jgi:hypothetical protein